MATFINPDYETRIIGRLTKAVCGDYIDFGGSFFTIEQADQPGWLRVKGDDYTTFEIAYQDVCAAIDTELIVRKGGSRG